MVSGRGLAKENVWTGINWHHQISVKLLDLSRFVECGSVHWLLERAAKWQPHMPKVKLKRRHSIHTAAPEGKEELQHLQLPAKWNQHRIPLAPCAKIWKYLPVAPMSICGPYKKKPIMKTMIACRNGSPAFWCDQISRKQRVCEGFLPLGTALNAINMAATPIR